MNRNAERMRYQTDKLSYWLCIFSIICNAVYFVGLYTNRGVAPDVTVGADILINIIFMMVVFLGSEKLKAYQKNWGAYMMATGAVQILRIFWLPMHFHQLEMLTGFKYMLEIVSLLASGILLLFAGINSSRNVGILRRFDESRVGE